MTGARGTLVVTQAACLAVMIAFAPTAAAQDAVPNKADTVRAIPVSPAPISGRYLPPADAKYVTEEVRVRTAERQSLAGTLVLPWRPVMVGPNRVRFPVVLMISDGGAHNRDHTPAESLGISPEREPRPFAAIADTLARLGVASLRLDDRGVGSSTGSLATADALDLAYDARSALRYLRERREIDPERCVVLGIGEGALSAAMVGRFESDLAGIVLMASPADRGSVVEEWRSRRGRPASGRGAGRDSLPGEGPRKFLEGYDPMTTARTLASPVLLLEAGNDEAVPPGSAARLSTAMRAGGNAAVTVSELPGLPHDFSRRDAAGNPRLAPEALAALAAWIRDRVAPR